MKLILFDLLRWLWLGVRVFLLGGLVVFAFYFEGFGQERGLPVALRNGEALPGWFWSRQFEVYEGGRLVRKDLSAYRDRLLVFDFWASWCGGCLKGFKVGDSLQRVYPELKVLGVNEVVSRDSRDKVVSVLDGQAVRMESLVMDSVVRALFPHRLLPHYVLVSDGQFRAAVGAELFNGATIEAVLGKRALVRKVKGGRP